MYITHHYILIIVNFYTAEIARAIINNHYNNIIRILYNTLISTHLHSLWITNGNCTLVII